LCVDLGITISNDLCPRLHINTIVAKAHKRANAIHRCFISKDVNTLMRAFIVYVRPIVEYNSLYGQLTSSQTSSALKVSKESSQNVSLVLVNTPTKTALNVCHCQA